MGAVWIDGTFFYITHVNFAAVHLDTRPQAHLFTHQYFQLPSPLPFPSPTTTFQNLPVVD